MNRRLFTRLFIRVFTRLLYSLLGTFVVLSALLFALIGTVPGTRWLLDVAVRVGHMPVHIERSSGTLLNGLTLYGVDWRDAAGDLRIARLSLRWRPLDLFTGTLHLDELSAKHILLVLPQTPAPTTTKAAAPLPSIALPFGVDLAELRLRDITVVRGAQRVRISEIKANATVESSRLNVGALDITAPQGSAQLQGSLTLAPPYASTVRLTWHWRQADGAALAGKGRLSGNLHRIKLEQTLTAPFTAHLDGWVAPRTRQVDLTLTWQQARWPLQQSADPIRSAHGTLHVSGGLDAYRAALNADLSGSRIPTATLALKGAGDRRHISIDTLHLDTLGGQIDGHLNATLTPTLSWQATLTGRGIDPAKHWSEWPGRIAFAVAGSGTRNSARLKLSKLAGTLRGKPLRATLAARWQNDTLHLNEANIEVAGGQLKASGTATRARGKLAVSLNLPQLANLLPTAQGSLRGSAKLSGPWQWPRITATLQGRQLRWDTIAIAQADLNVIPTPGDTLRATLALRGVQRGTTTLSSVQAVVAGDLHHQRIKLDAHAKQGGLALQLAGALDRATRTWRGQLTQLALTPDKGPRWQLAQPATLELGPTVQRIGQTCLRPATSANANAGVCLDMDAAQGRLDAAATIRALPLALLNPWLPAGTVITGRIDGKAALHGPFATLDGQLQAQLTHGAVTMDGAGGHHVVHFDVPRLAATLHHGALTANAQATLPDQHGTFSARTTLGAPNAQGVRVLGGRLQFDLPDLAALQPFVPQVNGLAGKASAQFTLGGTSAQPQLAGSATLSNGAGTLIASGTHLQHMQLQAVLPKNQDLLTLKASARAGQGTLQAQGQVTHLLHGPQLTLKVTGNHFQAVDLPQVTAAISPQLNITADAAQIKVRGKVAIPKAKISVQRLPPQAVSVSPDARVVGRKQARATGPQINAEVELIIGNQVSINAMGLSAMLNGNLLVSEQGNAGATADGSLNITDGTYSAYGLDLTLSRGVLNFAGPVGNPGLDIVAERKTGTVTAQLAVTGTLKSPQSQVSATPPMSQADALSWLITGHGLGSASASDAALLLKAVYSMNVDNNSNGGGLVGKIEKSTGLNSISVQGGDTLQQSSLVLGKYLTPKLYVSYATGLFQRSNTLSLTYQLSKHLSAEAKSGAAQGLSLLYQINFGKR
ncbi:translocation/assembly module TamB domain-containing protein [Acidihalobacter ferrooxydans]|uniref:Translocation and assembly module TamB C-terminal domain-containing protein n=1 Tax=Acidihalobacter ferrooxydans TaxID=1765967 RepID=A0A1P8UE68_9GAMM|nr:translocation/assembly module TamB domain-containing protein [Acidihalobacter ferrooxydans]APZ42088.1 hypothetical protein BW247_02410 [Acidihalobacter ferrooxydans]